MTEPPTQKSQFFLYRFLSIDIGIRYLSTIDIDYWRLSINCVWNFHFSENFFEYKTDRHSWTSDLYRLISEFDIHRWLISITIDYYPSSVHRSTSSGVFSLSRKSLCVQNSTSCPGRFSLPHLQSLGESPWGRGCTKLIGTVEPITSTFDQST